MSGPANAAEPVEKRRPWYRLHISTLLVLIVAASVLVLVVVPGDFEDMVFLNTGAFFTEQGSVEHGWPGVYLRRVTGYQSSGPPRPELGIPWLTKEAWEFSGEEREFRPATLAMDVAAAVAILAALGAAVEWRRRRHHRAWQFSLGEVLLLTLFVAGVLGWWQYNRRCFQREKELMAISRAEYDVRGDGQMKCRGPVWLRKLAGAGNLKAFHRVTEVSLRDAQCSDEQISQSFQEIRSLLACPESLHLRSKYLTDAGLAHLAEFPHLRSLTIDSRRVTDAGLEHVAGLHGLEELRLLGCRITDQGLKPLSQLKDLRSLTFVVTDLDGSGLVYLAELKKLESLVLINTPVSDKSVEEFRAHMPECRITRGMNRGY